MILARFGLYATRTWSDPFEPETQRRKNHDSCNILSADARFHIYIKSHCRQYRSFWHSVNDNILKFLTYPCKTIKIHEDISKTQEWQENRQINQRIIFLDSNEIEEISCRMRQFQEKKEEKRIIHSRIVHGAWTYMNSLKTKFIISFVKMNITKSLFRHFVLY